MKRAALGLWMATMWVGQAALALEPASPEPAQADDRGHHDDAARAAPGHRHDRVYLGFSAGFGPQYESLRSAGPRGEVTGVGTQSSLAIGYHVSPQWMLGAMAGGSRLLASNYHPEADAEVIPDELDPSRRDLLFAGPFVHWHPSLDSGWYGQLALAVATLDTHAMSGDYSANGGGAEIGLGYEWFRSDGFYLGALAATRITVLRGVSELGDVWWHTHSSAGSLSLTAGYN